MEINVEKIMQEIRAEIEEKGITNDVLSFDEVPIPSQGNPGLPRSDEFEIGELCTNVDYLNLHYQISPDTMLMRGPGLKGLIGHFLKRIVRKCVWPLVTEQNGFNAATVRSLNQIHNFVGKEAGREDELEELRKRVRELEKEIDRLNREGRK